MDSNHSTNYSKFNIKSDINDLFDTLDSVISYSEKMLFIDMIVDYIYENYSKNNKECNND
jgi:hypothetical protein